MDCGKLITDGIVTGQDSNVRIDGSGYLVVEINGREYREITTNLTGDLFVDPRPTYDDDDPIRTAGPVSPPYYVDSSKNVVDSNGEAVYFQTGTGC